MALITFATRSQDLQEKKEQPTVTSELPASDENEIPDHWDFYICTVDDAPASIFLNLWFRDEGPVGSADHLYWCDIEILEPGERGMGVGTDAEALQDLEDAIYEKAQAAGFYYVGRLRNHGRWQLAFYGAENLEPVLNRIAAEIIPRVSGRSYEIGSKPDAEWTYYFEFLCPNDERWQWIQNRRVLDSLQSHGDPLTQPRRIDHWAYFAGGAERDAFVDVTAKLGFQLERKDDETAGDRPFSAQIYRIDSVQLDDIHKVVMSLVTAAQQAGGDYDGWETSVETP